MACWLKQSTAVDVAIGPFLDSVDGNTVEGSLTITQPDIRLKKNGGAWAQKSAAQTLSHEEAGWYECALSTTDTDTLGILIVAIHETGALPAWREFMVVPANVYDAFLASDKLQVDVVEYSGTAVATPNVPGTPAVDVGRWLGTVPATPTFAGIPEVDVTAWLGAAVPSPSAAGYPKVDVHYVAATGQTAGNIIARLPAALVGGRMDASVGAMAPNVLTAAAIDWDAITAAKIAAGAITSAKFAADAITAAVIAPGAIDLATLAADTDVYAARGWITDDDAGTADRYGCVWYKNGQEITAGITLPKIRVYKQADGTDLIAETAMTEIGSEQTFRHDEATNRTVDGVGYIIRWKATIGGSVRTSSQPFGRPTS